MASTSNLSVQKSFKYDVFLSFRGEDTRNTFVGHLYNALQQNGIEAYKDDQKIKKGETIDTQLIKSIEDSRFFIIVFSKNYASSSWCLDELVKIMECQKTTEQTAYPVFYDVEPTEVRKQSGAVGQAFKEHKNKEAAGKWREALKEAANLAGWELKKTANGDESKLIQIVVADIFKKICLFGSSVDDKLVGMEVRINEVLSSLELGTEDVRMIGIKGMGGGGKTTLATALFNHISNQFEGRSFVENVREVSKTSLSGLKELQKQILKDVFSDQDITVSSVSGGINMMVQMMHRKKVLVILDDVNDTKQLEALAGASNWFKPGSRIIITTRDEQVLLAHRLNFNHNFIHEVSLLSPKESISLFSRYAFGREIPVEGYEHLSRKVVQYAAGLPLTIKVLGSFLCFQEKPEWNDALERLKTIPLNETMMILELSYNSLEDDYKDIFLDVACLLKGWFKIEAIVALESCGFRAINGLRVLEQKSLITISKAGVLGMHDHIEEMGKNIVRRVNPNKPERHSRLWIKEEIVDILANDSGTQATKCIRLNAYGLNFEILMNGLANMKELRFLRVYAPYVSEAKVRNWNFDEDGLHLPNALLFLSWYGYPFSSLPKTFQAKNLVGLEMDSGNIDKLWKDGEEKALKLRFLKFTDCHKLRTLDLSVAPNLETLNLELCYNLVEVHFQVTPNLKELRIIECVRLEKLHMPVECPKLVKLDLSNSKLRALHLGITPNLETLSLLYCTDMVELKIPAECPKLVNFELFNVKLMTLDLGISPNLEKLTLQRCAYMVELQIPSKCSKLVSLELSSSNLRTLHLGITPNLEKLTLQRCAYMVDLQIPSECPKLVSLELSSSNLRTLHLGITPNLETLRLVDCTDLVELHMPAECPKLVKLHLRNLKLRTLHLGITPNLEMLSLLDCTDMVELHMPAECPKLVNLYLRNSKLRTLHHRITPNLETLSLKDCRDLVELQDPAECPKLVNLDLHNLKLTTLHLRITPNLETVSLIDCCDSVELQIPAECPKLVTLDLRYLKLMSLHLGITPKLETLILQDCCDLVELHLGVIPDLKTLSLAGCDSLVELHMPFDCPKLKFLSFCNTKLNTLDLGLAPNLQTLDLKECYDLVEISTPIRYLKTLSYLDLTDCVRFESFFVGQMVFLS